MNKQEFLEGLKKKLNGVPEDEIDERLSFYSEMIDDRIEDGISEEDAVAEIGSVESIAEQILADIPLSKIAKEKIKKRRRLRAWEIVLLAAGSPIWLALLIVALAVILVLYVSIWAVVISLWAVFGALAGCALGGISGGTVLAVFSDTLVGIALIGAGIACAGLAIFFFFGCMVATDGTVWIAKKIVLGIKKCFVGKGNAQ